MFVVIAVFGDFCISTTNILFKLFSTQIFLDKDLVIVIKITVGGCWAIFVFSALFSDFGASKTRTKRAIRKVLSSNKRGKSTN